MTDIVLIIVSAVSIIISVASIILNVKTVRNLLVLSKYQKQKIETLVNKLAEADNRCADMIVENDRLRKLARSWMKQ